MIGLLEDFAKTWALVLAIVAGLVVLVLVLSHYFFRWLDWRDLKLMPQGKLMKGPDVESVQSDLLELGLLFGSRRHFLLDGFYGPHTKAGVCSFQHALRLPVTGVVDRRTRRELTRAAEAMRRQAKVAARAAVKEVRNAVSEALGELALKPPRSFPAEEVIGGGDKPCARCGTPFFSRAGSAVCFGCRGNADFGQDNGNTISGELSRAEVDQILSADNVIHGEQGRCFYCERELSSYSLEAQIAHVEACRKVAEASPPKGAA